MKLGVITDGISRDLGHALAVMGEFGLDYAELQFFGEKEVGDLDAAAEAAALALVRGHGAKVSCISRHLFAGMRMGDAVGGGEGQLADQFRPMADALRADGYDGVISFESVYHPGDGDFEAGFRQNIGVFKEIFG